MILFFGPLKGLFIRNEILIVTYNRTDIILKMDTLFISVCLQIQMRNRPI